MPHPFFRAPPSFRADRFAFATTDSPLIDLGSGGWGSVADVLNFALTLEYLEAEFYDIALRTPGLIPGRYRVVFSQIGLHEKEHVATLQGALGPAAIGSPRFDYTGKDNFRTCSRTSTRLHACIEHLRRSRRRSL